MPGRVLVDTNVVIYLATGHELSRVYRRHLEGNVVALSFATAAELLYTARRTRNPIRTVAYWREKLPLYVVLFPDLETCDIWARITAEMKGRGQPRQDNDLWIAATALRYDLPLVTHNLKDFTGITGLTLISEAPLGQ